MKLKKNLIWLFTFFATTLFFSLPVNAQVIIGSTDGTPQDPRSYSLLELISNKGGLRMPQLTLSQRIDLDFEGRFIDPAADSEDEKIAPLAKGLCIYNTTVKCLEYWNGKAWITICTGICKGPELIGGISGAISVFSGETDIYYSVTKIPDVIYGWTVPSGWTKTGDSDFIKVTAGTNGGKITVIPTKDCAGDEKELNVSIYTLGCCKNPPKITITGTGNI